MAKSDTDDAFVRECANLDSEEEVSVAEEGMAAELESWPEY